MSKPPIQHFLLLLFIVICGSSIQAQIADSLVQENPNSVIYNHLYYLQDEQFEPERAALSFPPNTEFANQKAIKLKQILDGKGLYIDIHRVPKDPMYKDSIAQEYLYFINHKEPLIYVERMDTSWYYSRTTIESIDKLHAKMYPFGASLSTYFTNPMWRLKLLGIQFWKWLGIGVLILITLLSFGLINFLGKKIVSSILKKKFGVNINYQKNTKFLSRLLGLYIAASLFLFLLPMVELPIRIQAMLIKALHILSIFFILFIFVQIIQIIFKYANRFAASTESTLDDQLMPLVRRLLLIVIWVFGAFYILDYLDINVTALLAGISIGGLAIALAAQDTVKNFFGSIMIFVDKPFKIGDAISFKGTGGVVEEVGVRSTRIRTFENSLTYVPNGLLADAVVDNLGLRQYRRFKSEIGIAYDTPPKAIDLFVKGIRKIIDMHPMTRKDAFEVHLNSFGPSSLNILLYMFFEVPGWTDELESRHQILYAIMVLAEDLGVEFAFPTQTLHIESMPTITATSGVKSKNMKGDDHLDQSIQRIKSYFDQKHEA